MNEFIDRLEAVVGREHVLKDVSMSKYTSFKAGGNADYLVEPNSIEELQNILRVLADSEEEVPHILLGNGSNILVKDGGYKGVIIKLGGGFNETKVEDDKIECGAGALLSSVAKAAASAELTGLEFASGIPGSIGGAVFMNAGAYDGEIKNVLEEAYLVSADGSKTFKLSAEELDMGYRHSLIQETGDIVVSATFKLANGDESAIKEKMAELAAKRNSKQPVQYPSAGSFFKRPEGYFAGKLIQDAGCKGLSVGGAQVSTLHSGFIINTGGATATDIIRLKDLVQACVKEQFGVMLEPEVRIIGEDINPKSNKKQDGANERDDLIEQFWAAKGVDSAHRSSGEEDIETKDSSLSDADDNAGFENMDDYEILYDLHTHTTYSHGKGSVEDNVRVALEKGLEFVAISDHGPGHLFYGVNRNDFDNLKLDVDKMNVKYQSVRVKNSIEANIIHCKTGNGVGSTGLDISPEEFEEFDFVIAGFHFGCFGCSSIRNWLWSHGIKINEESLRHSNTKMIVDALRKNDIAILTHPGDKGPFDIEEIAKVCAETNTLVEINGRHGHLNVEEIKIAMQVPDVMFIISSDAHTPDAVGTYKEALRRAFEAGLDISRIVNVRKK